MADKEFYLGRIFDIKTGKTSAEKLQYDPADLTTHAVVTGMTGSGKTGLCMALLEEAALQGIPASIIDPKGDLTNLLLHFPDLAPRTSSPGSTRISPGAAARRWSRLPRRPPSPGGTAWRNGISPRSVFWH